jgi:hypothetical protein
MTARLPTRNPPSSLEGLDGFFARDVAEPSHGLSPISIVDKGNAPFSVRSLWISGKVEPANDQTNMWTALNGHKYRSLTRWKQIGSLLVFRPKPASYGLANVRQRFLFVFALTHATGKSGTFRHDPAIFLGVQDNMKHHGETPRRSVSTNQLQRTPGNV